MAGVEDDLGIERSAGAEHKIAGITKKERHATALRQLRENLTRTLWRGAAEASSTEFWAWFHSCASPSSVHLPLHYGRDAGVHLSKTVNYEKGSTSDLHAASVEVSEVV